MANGEHENVVHENVVHGNVVHENVVHENVVRRNVVHANPEPPVPGGRSFRLGPTRPRSRAADVPGSRVGTS